MGISVYRGGIITINPIKKDSGVFIMGLFNKKREFGIEEYCHYYYDLIFHPVTSGSLAGKEVHKILLDVQFNLLVEADQSFAGIDRNLFHTEMQSLQLELFSLAWMERFKKGYYILPQVIFTHQYLEDNGRLDVWDAMNKYNSVIGKTATMDNDGQQMTIDTALGRVLITSINESRWRAFKSYLSANIEDPSKPTEEEKIIVGYVARSCNYIGANLMKRNQIGSRQITALFLFRIGWDEDKELSNDALFRLAAQTLNIYETAKNTLKGIDLKV
ncbi:MAG: hypothetical protein Q8P44_05900 [Dehalococcoidia bacterium]|nr:hypothetical protein [Dehalococcoidia bacterium]